jgi:hypothetical protein
MFVALQIAMFIVLLELTVGSFVTLFALDVRGDSSRGFILFQGGLYLFFALLTLLAMNNFATPELVSNIVLDSAWLRWQGPLVLIFSLLMIPWNVLLWLDPTSSPKTRKKPAPADSEEAAAAPVDELILDDLIPRVRLLRFLVGAIGSAVGLAAVFVVGMAYRTLADTRLGGTLVVVALLAGALALGGIMTAMLLGHWYLNTPTASGRPLEFSTTLTLVALAIAFACALFLGPSTLKLHDPGMALSPGTSIIDKGSGGIVITTPTPQPTGTAGQQPAGARQAPLDTSAFVWLQYLMGFAAPLVLGYLALRLTRERSFQSATGMLYLCVAFVFIGEILGRGLLLMPRF